METADAIAALVDAQLARFGNSKAAECFRKFRITPRAEERAWDYGPAGTCYTCWIVFEHRDSNIGIAYSSSGFGPRCPWGLLFLDGDEAHRSIGMDSGWFSELESAVYDTWAFDEFPANDEKG